MRFDFMERDYSEDYAVVRNRKIESRWLITAGFKLMFSSITCPHWCCRSVRSCCLHSCSVSFVLECKLQTVKCFTLIRTG